jgi:hypothetical protein
MVRKVLVLRLLVPGSQINEHERRTRVAQSLRANLIPPAFIDLLVSAA